MGLVQVIAVVALPPEGLARHLLQASQVYALALEARDMLVREVLAYHRYEVYAGEKTR